MRNLPIIGDWIEDFFVSVEWISRSTGILIVSRAQLLTGCYGARIDVPGVYSPAPEKGLNPDEVTVAEHLKELDYATACIGKWHVGDQPEFLPTNQGFDHYFGIPYSNDQQRISTESGKKVVPLLRDDKVAELLTDDQQSKSVERYTEDAKNFITTNKDKPFFLYLPHTAIHTPIFPGKAFRGKSGNGRVEELDWSTGRLLDTLRKLKLDSNTLVIFTSDNGSWLIKGADSGSGGVLRGGKGEALGKVVCASRQSPGGRGKSSRALRWTRSRAPSISCQPPSRLQAAPSRRNRSSMVGTSAPSCWGNRPAPPPRSPL